MARTSLTADLISDATAEPTWEIAHLFPAQGMWSEEEYLALETNHLIEFSDGRLEFLPMPTYWHQRLVRFLFLMLDGFVVKHSLGEATFAPVKVRVGPGKVREPDVVFVVDRHLDRYVTTQYLLGADLVMEVVSPDDPDRDRVTKRQEYAQARIPEYWIVDPDTQRITVLTLSGESYTVHGDFVPGEQATSRLLDGFAVDVTEAFQSAERQ